MGELLDKLINEAPENEPKDVGDRYTNIGDRVKEVEFVPKVDDEKVKAQQEPYVSYTNKDGEEVTEILEGDDKKVVRQFQPTIPDKDLKKSVQPELDI